MHQKNSSRHVLPYRHVSCSSSIGEPMKAGHCSVQISCKNPASQMLWFSWSVSLGQGCVAVSFMEPGEGCRGRGSCGVGSHLCSWVEGDCRGPTSTWGNRAGAAFPTSGRPSLRCGVNRAGGSEGAHRCWVSHALGHWPPSLDSIPASRSNWENIFPRVSIRIQNHAPAWSASWPRGDRSSSLFFFFLILILDGTWLLVKKAHWCFESKGMWTTQHAKFVFFLPTPITS